MSKIKIVEVGPRDGLQNEKTILSLDQKKEYIRLLSLTGLKTIEAGSFVRADAIKQMESSDKLFLSLKEEKYFNDISFPFLVPNKKGMQIAASIGVKEVSLFTAVSDAFTKKNINCNIDESFERMLELKEFANPDMKYRGYISTVFGCPYQGKVDERNIVKVTERLLELGVEEVSYGDTIGVAQPKQVQQIIKLIKQSLPIDKIAMHFHDTRKMAVSNCLMSLNEGIKVFDSSSGGLGGCPYAKGASGNVATEDILNLCSQEGLDTGIDLDKLLDASAYVLSLVNKKSPSAFVQSKLQSR